ncbi:MAG TPA: HDOD domain-containing protein [Polyangiaceae bacterium]|nr:HDOD domain-containing protein [Polyangiaceae bacterium]
MSNTEAMQRALTDVVSRGDFVVPPYPAVALRLQRLLAREGYGVAEVADVLAADAALATTVLAAANSALLGGSTEITSLSRAVNRLGARTVGSIAIASGVGAVALTTGVLQDVKFRVWRRGMTCALACQKLGGARGLAPEDAFLAGLLYGFGRSIAIASLEQLLKTHQPPRPLSVAEWLNIAEQQRGALAQAVAKGWQLPPSVAEAITGSAGSSSASLHELVLHADRIAGDLDAGRMPQAQHPTEIRLLDELIAGLPGALEAFAPPVPQPTTRPSPPSAMLAKPDHALDGELRRKALKVVDRRAKGAANLTCKAVGATGIEVESSKPFQESSMVRLVVGDSEPRFDPWFNVVLCVATGSGYRVELELFSPTRETREQWRAIYEAP